MNFHIVVTVSILVSARVYCFLLNNNLPQYKVNGRSLVLVGGNLQENNTEVYNTIVKLAGGKGVAKIGIINAASADPLGDYNYFSNVFLKYGVLSADRIPIDVNHTNAGSDPDVLKLIKQQTGFFFGGGDPYRLIQCLFSSNHIPVPALLAIKEMFDKGVVVSGTSAGAMCQASTIMIRRGASWEALRYGAHDTYDPSESDNLVYYSAGGIGMLDNFVLDVHSGQRGREGRLIALLAGTRDHKLGSNYGIGIDENTALVITHVGTDMMNGEIQGEHGATFFDLSSASIDTSSQYFSIRDVYLHYLTNGDNIGLNRLNITFSSSKSIMRQHEAYDHSFVSNDIFDRNTSQSQIPEFVRAATSVFDARFDRTTYGNTYEENPKFRVFLSATGRDAEGWVERKTSFDTDIKSYRNLYVEITSNQSRNEDMYQS